MVGRGAVIAIVEDDAPVRKALARLLDALSFQTRSYDSARAFLAALPGGLPQCLIVDLQMPEMTGLELQRHLERTGFTIPPIVITAHDDAGVREQCERAGAVAFLLKPVAESNLVSAINDALSIPATAARQPGVAGGNQSPR